jgi:tRNA threonylcarbamoyladenosine biosynthesis protein TsaB
MRSMLAFDTSTACARVAILSPAGECLAKAEKVATRHSSNLLRLCDEVLRATGTIVSELGALACGSGPGSFTGLRVGLAVAKGLALADRIPLVLVPSLDALAVDLAGSESERLVLPCIDAGKGQVYGRLYRVAGQTPAPISADEIALVPEDLCRLVQEQAIGAAVVAGGNGVDRYQEVFRAQLGAEAVHFQVAGPSALAVGRLAFARLARGEHDDLETSVPRYGRPPDITKPKAAPTTSAR